MLRILWMALASLIVIGTTGIFASRANAQSLAETEADAEARARFEAGRALVQVGSYEAARLEFRRGYLLSERPLFLFNMAECARHLGQAAVARREYAEYVRQDADGAFVAMAESRLVELGPGDRSTPAFVTEPANVPLDVPAEQAAVSLTTEVPANSVDLSVAEQPEERRWFRDWPFWTAVGGLVLAGVVAGVVLGTRDANCGSGCQELDWRMP